MVSLKRKADRIDTLEAENTDLKQKIAKIGKLEAQNQTLVNVLKDLLSGNVEEAKAHLNEVSKLFSNQESMEMGNIPDSADLSPVNLQEEISLAGQN
jgi:BioD-like phosphotransacetylase family protein